MEGELVARVEGVQGGVAGRRVNPALGRKHGQPAGPHPRDRKTSLSKEQISPPFPAQACAERLTLSPEGTRGVREGCLGRTRADAVDVLVGLFKVPKHMPTAPCAAPGPTSAQSWVSVESLSLCCWEGPRLREMEVEMKNKNERNSWPPSIF